MPTTRRLVALSALAILFACSDPPVSVEMALPQQLALSDLSEASLARLRAVASIPGVLPESPLEIDIQNNRATGTFSLAGRSVDGTLIVTFYSALSASSPEVVIAQSSTPISIRKGKSNATRIENLQTSGSLLFDSNRNGLSNIDDLLSGLEPAALPPPLTLSPLTVGFESGVEVGGFTRDFLVLENTTFETLDVDLNVRLAPGVTITPLDALFESGGNSAAKSLSLTLAPEQGRVIAVTFAPVNPLFTVGRVAAQTRIVSNGVIYGGSAQIVGNPEGPIPRPPADYVVPTAPAGGIPDYTGPIDIYPPNFLFSRAPLRVAVDEADFGSITTEVTALDAFGETTTVSTAIDVDAAYLVLVPAQHRFSAALDELASDVDMYAFALSPTFQPPPSLDCAAGTRCSRNLGVSFESVEIDALGNTEDTLVLLAFDRVNPAGPQGSEVGTVQTGLFSVPEFLDPCDPADAGCQPPVESSQTCPPSYGNQVCSAEGGGALITLRGQNFAPGATINIGPEIASCTDVVPDGAIDVIRCTAPTASIDIFQAPTVRITVTNPDGEAATIADGITYVPPPPLLLAAVPSEGPNTGGTTVWLQASETFQAGDALPAVTFNGTSAEVNAFDSSTGAVRVIAPACAACVDQAVDIVMTNPDGQESTLAGGFTYRSPTAAPPVITAVTPPTASAVGGENLVIEGSGFVAGVRVLIGGAFAEVSTVDPLVVVAPPGFAGPAELEVVNPDGQTARNFDLFAYTSPVPIITSIMPSNGTQAGGTPITIDGSGFLTGALVTVGGVLATNTVVTSTTSIQTVTPAGAVGAADVVVTNLDGESFTSTGGFTFDPAAAPTLSSVTPGAGPSGGGTAVILDGTGFQSGALVSFGPAVAPSCATSSSTRIVCITPSGPSGAVDVLVSNPDGQNVTLASSYTFGAPSGPGPSITDVSPEVGSASGGNQVVITGENFDGSATVFFGLETVPIDTINVGPGLDDITITTPVASEGVVTLRVQNPDGQQDVAGFQVVASNAPVALLQDPPPTATSVSRSTAITVVFNESMDATTLTDQNIRLEDGPTLVNGNVIASGPTAILQPSAPLQGDTVYTVTLTTNLQSAIGVPLAAPVTWSFTTETAVDTDGPVLVSSDPMSGATGVPINAEVTVTFNEAIDAGTVDATSFVVEDSGGTTVPGSRSVQGSSILFSPLAPYAYGDQHTVRITPAVSDLLGNGLFGQESFNFTVAPFVPDTTAPTIVSTTPVATDPDVRRTVIIEAVFDEPINGLTVDNASFSVTDDTLVMPVTGTVLQATPERVTFTPDQPLAEGNDFTVSLSAAIEDVAGNSLVPFNWSFTTRVRTWQGPVQVSSGVDVTSTVVAATDFQGNRWIRWPEAGVPDDIWYLLRYTPGLGFGTPMPVGTGTVSRVSYTFDTFGDGTLMWFEENGGTYEIHVREYDAETGFEAGSTIINTDTANEIRGPAIGTSRIGHRHVFFNQFNGSTWELRYSIRQPGSTTWSAPALVQDCNTQECFWNFRHMNNAGDIGIVYSRNNNSFRPQFRYYDNVTSSWRAELQLDTAILQYTFVHTLPGGDVLLMWGDGVNIDSARYLRATSMIADQINQFDLQSFAANILRGSAQLNGDSFAVWQQQDNMGNFDVFGARYTYATNSWSTPGPLDMTVEAVDGAAVRADANGNALAYWRQFDGTAYSLYVSHYEVMAGAWSVPAPIESAITDVISPVIATADTGDASAAWREQGAIRHAWVNIFE